MRETKYDITSDDVEKVAVSAGVSEDMVRKVMRGERSSRKIETALKAINIVRRNANKKVASVIEVLEKIEESVTI
jgi:molybdopterin-biosynthesis enzyme MoeA-like protein